MADRSLAHALLATLATRLRQWRAGCRFRHLWRLPADGIKVCGRCGAVRGG